MTFINPQPETPAPIIKPRKDETLRSWLTRKNHAMLFHDFEVVFPGQSWHNKLVDYWQEEVNNANGLCNMLLRR